MHITCRYMLGPGITHRSFMHITGRYMLRPGNTHCSIHAYDSQMTYKVKTAQASHEALDIVGHSEEALFPARLPLDLGLDAGLHAVQNPRYCCKDAGAQGRHIIRHLLHISLQRKHDNRLAVFRVLECIIGLNKTVRRVMSTKQFSNPAALWHHPEGPFVICTTWMYRIQRQPTCWMLMLDPHASLHAAQQTGLHAGLHAGPHTAVRQGEMRLFCMYGSDVQNVGPSGPPIQR